MPLIPALGRLRKEVCEFKSSLSYIVRKKNIKKEKTKEKYDERCILLSVLEVHDQLSLLLLGL
jgi:hypothetical protein